MANGMLELNSPKAQQLGFTSDNFEGGIIFTDFPNRKLFITRLEPVSERGLNVLLEKLAKYKINFTYSAPPKEISQWLMDKGYWFSIDVAGLPFYSNYKPTKNIRSSFKI